MRLLRWTVLLAITGTLVWVADIYRPVTDQPGISAAVSEAEERAGVSRMLRGQAQMVLSDLVIEDEQNGVRDFRARLLRDGRLRPTYGQARRLCLKGLDDPSCWEIAVLEVDGEAAGIMAAASQQVEEIETADIPVPAKAAAVIVETPPLPAVALVAVKAPVLSATHRVARDVINARSGPGTDNPVVTRLLRGTDLVLLDQQDGWGRFRILDASENTSADADVYEVWAALRILEILP
ncbi:MAG: SH3 domain-containing protein [Pseudomonadota bacterium]